MYVCVLHYYLPLSMIATGSYPHDGERARRVVNWWCGLIVVSRVATSCDRSPRHNVHGAYLISGDLWPIDVDYWSDFKITDIHCNYWSRLMRRTCDHAQRQWQDVGVCLFIICVRTHTDRRVVYAVVSWRFQEVRGKAWKIIIANHRRAPSYVSDINGAVCTLFLTY